MKKNTMSRTRARACLVLTFAGIAAVAVGLLASVYAVAWCGLAVMVAAFFVIEHKCPHCGGWFFRRVAPQWSKPGKLDCEYCGRHLAYDDETEGN